MSDQDQMFWPGIGTVRITDQNQQKIWDQGSQCFTSTKNIYIYTTCHDPVPNEEFLLQMYVIIFGLIIKILGNVHQ